jgi:hypothetical protein
VTNGAILGSVASLRPEGVMRFVGALFLLFWLTGWAVAEVVGLVVLGMTIAALWHGLMGSTALFGLLDQFPALESATRPAADRFDGAVAAIVILFILVWVLFWTVGGLAATSHFARSVAGEDRFELTASGFSLVRRAGPFHRTRRFDRSAVRRLRVRGRDQMLVADTARGVEVLTEFGTSEERKSVRQWLAAHLHLPEERLPANDEPPPGWSMRPEGEGLVLMRHDARTRRSQIAIMWILTGVAGLALIFALQTAGVLAAPTALMSVVTLPLAVGATWLTWGGTQWIVRERCLTVRRYFAAWRREDTFEHAVLEVEASVDGDGDENFRLLVRNARGSRTIASAVDDEAGVVDLGRWIAGRTRFRLELAHELRAAWPK